MTARIRAAEAYLKALQLQIKDVRDSLRATYLANNKMAADVAEMQLKAAEAIDLRTRAQAQAAAPKSVAEP